MLRYKSLEAITEADLLQLIADSIGEDRHLDYKAALPGGGDSDRKEFLADVSSFANADGGHIVFGLSESEGIPIRLSPLAGDADATKLRLEQMIRDGIEPRIPGTGLKHVPLSGGGFAIVLYIPRSFAQPHIVTYKSESRFYSRGAGGKYALDVGQIRTAFAASEAVTTRVRQFQVRRLAAIVAGETPVPVGGRPEASCASCATCIR